MLSLLTHHVLAGEDALANLSVERTEGGTITGHVRIRSKTQGIALSLGDRITMGTLLLCWFPWSIADVHLQRKRTTSLLYRFCCIERYNILDPLRLAQSPHGDAPIANQILICTLNLTPHPSLVHLHPPPMPSRSSDVSDDREKGLQVEVASAVSPSHLAPEDALVKRYGRFGPFLAKLFASGVEARGVERVPEDQRETKNMWNK